METYHEHIKLKLGYADADALHQGARQWFELSHHNSSGKSPVDKSGIWSAKYQGRSPIDESPNIYVRNLNQPGIQK